MRFDDIDSEFRFDRLIARTSKSNVWIATGRDGKCVVIKEILINRVVNPEHVFNERAVLQLLTDLAFPRAPWLIGTAKSKDSLFIVQTLVEGAPLNMHLPPRGFDKKTAKKYFAETLSIMEFLHEHNILYRDLKLSNLVLSEGRIFLVDFGLSKIMNSRTCRTNSVCGTVHAMAPEISKGEPYGFAVDFWALGILLCELLTGNPPFGYVPKVDEITSDKLEEVCASVTEEARTLIRGLLSVDPQKRITSFEEIRSSKFFEDCYKDWWRSARYDDPLLPGIGNELGQSFIRGPRDVFEDF